jgi:hypothetical protein
MAQIFQDVRLNMALHFNLISTIDIYDKLVIARGIFEIYFNVNHVVVKEKNYVFKIFFILH